MDHIGPTRKRLPEKVLEIREALGLSQRQMAERLEEKAGKITYKNISKYERDRSVPPLEVVLAYARVVSVKMEQIVDDNLDLNLQAVAHVGKTTEN